MINLFSFSPFTHRIYEKHVYLPLKDIASNNNPQYNIHLKLPILVLWALLISKNNNRSRPYHVVYYNTLKNHTFFYALAQAKNLILEVSSNFGIVNFFLVFFVKFYFCTRRVVDLARSIPNSKQGAEYYLVTAKTYRNIIILRKTVKIHRNFVQHRVQCGFSKAFSLCRSLYWHVRKI